MGAEYPFPRNITKYINDRYSSSSMNEERITLENWKVARDTSGAARKFNPNAIFQTTPIWALTMARMARRRLTNDEREMSHEGIHVDIAEFADRKQLAKLFPYNNQTDQLGDLRTDKKQITKRETPKVEATPNIEKSNAEKPSLVTTVTKPTKSSKQQRKTK